MKTSLKNKFLITLVAILTLSMVGLGVFSSNSKHANAETSFVVRDSAELRVDDVTNGMRFVTE